MMRGTTRDGLRVVMVALALLSGWGLCLRWTGWRAAFGESNYVANRIRLEDYLFRGAAPRHVLVGSSLSGRLLPEYFRGTRLEDFGTLGLDGSIPLVGLEVLGRRVDLPEVVYVETYLMSKDWGVNDRTLLEGLDSAGIELARRVPVTRAASRPTSVLYSAMKLRKERAGSGLVETNVAGVREPGPAEAVPTVPPGLEERWRKVVGGLRDRGVRVVLVDVPGGELRMPGPRNGPDLGDVLASEFGLKRLDLRSAWFGRGWRPRYTDGRHLDVGSARMTAALLAELAP